MYVCGMTVYSDTHLGHARTYLAFDVIRRYLEYKGLKVTYIQNITDVEDKIIAAAQKEHVDALEYAKTYTDRCLHDLDRLGIRRADLYPKASETVPSMIAMIEQIIRNGYGYVADGDVYFSVEHFKDYGKLSGQKVEDMKAGARIQPGERKKNPLDFTLWKQAKPGEPSWDSTWGPGRPGWHIECSTMSSEQLGLPFDIHGGGMDLRFPHHENEIAQAEAATGKPFARIWMHVGLLSVNGEKMSKSLGNMINVRDLLKRWNPEVVRMFLAQAHYRSPPDFTEKALTDVQTSLDRIYRLKETLQEIAGNTSKESFDPEDATNPQKEYFYRINSFEQGFCEAMDDDFNTPRAFAQLFEFITDTNKALSEDILTPALAAEALNQMMTIGRVLTLFQQTSEDKQKDDEKTLSHLQQMITQFGSQTSVDSVEQAIAILLDLREQARQEKNWQTADEIRDQLQQLGFEIQDTDSGPKWRRT